MEYTHHIHWIYRRVGPGLGTGDRSGDDGIDRGVLSSNCALVQHILRIVELIGHQGKWLVDELAASNRTVDEPGLERTDDEPALRAGMTVTVSIDTERVRGLPDFVPQGIADLRLPDFLRRALALDKGRRE